jgi:DNA-binding NarL/FixJ family response regulator
LTFRPRAGRLETGHQQQTAATSEGWGLSIPGAEHTGVLLDPHPLWLDAIVGVLASVGVEVVGQATTPERALALLDEHRPDLFVTEIDMGESPIDGLTCVRRARERLPQLKIIVLATSADARTMDSAFAAGAVAYVMKRAQAEDLALTIRQTFEHSVYFMSGRAPSPTTVEEAEEEEEEESEPSWGLTRRELEILRLMAEGHSNTDLAKMLWVTEKTVKFHLSNVYRKLGVSNRTQASRWAQLHGVLPMRDERRLDRA